MCALCLLKLVHAKVASSNGFTTQNQEDVKHLFMVDVEEISIDLKLDSSVRKLVIAVSFMYMHVVNYLTGWQLIIRHFIQQITALFSHKLDSALHTFPGGSTT